jgi:uncharacterized repeat protein (TIGR03837 family)
VTSKLLQWDIFCHVIDNHGDLGVSWRLAVNLAERGHSVRLWVDDASALAWMAPHGHPKVEVSKWSDAEAALKLGDVIIEAFGCKLPTYIENLIAQQRSTWINLEYLSAEGYVTQSHGLASPVMQGSAKGQTKWFFYPGFVTGTGGLIRENDLKQRQSAFDRTAWLARYAPAISKTKAYAQTRWISLFCYEPTALQDLLKQLAIDKTPTNLLITQGRSQQAVAQVLKVLEIPASGAGNLQIEQLPYLSQTDYDHLLWACDLNFVRGEDSVVRALWAGKPFVWHIYPQDDRAHHKKLQAFCETLQMPHELTAFHAIWNGISGIPLPKMEPTQFINWTSWAQQTDSHLEGLQDLVTQLEQFVSQKR